MKNTEKKTNTEGWWSENENVKKTKESRESAVLTGRGGRGNQDDHRDCNFSARTIRKERHLKLYSEKPAFCFVLETEMGEIHSTKHS